LTSTTEEGLAELSNLADQINSNFAILKNDNARHVLQHCPSRLYRAVSAFTRSRRTLYARYKQDLDKVLGSRPKTLEPPNRNKEAYFALVDYITGTVARLVTRSAYSAGGYWENHALAILAQWAMKLKVLSYNPAHYAAIALEDGEVMIATQVEESRTKRELAILVPVAETANEFTSVNALDQETDITTRYYEENFLIRNRMENILRNALAALYASESSGNSASYFELSTLVYQTGIEKTLTVLANDRDGDYSASSDPAHVKCTFTAFEQLLSNALVLQAKERTRDTENEVLVRWEWSEGYNCGRYPTGQFSTSTSDELVSMLVPLGLSSIYTAYTVDLLVQLASTGTDEDDPILQFEPPPAGLKTEFTVSTAEYCRRLRKVLASDSNDPEVRSIPRSPLKRGIRGLCYALFDIVAQLTLHLAGTKIGPMLKQSEESPTEAEARAERMQKEYDMGRKQMEKWIISEDSVTIRCRLYVAIVLVSVAFLVCGGMAVPFAVGTRIRGVDPFQIATFSWVIGGFIVVLAKSRYVAEWPWHDFLRGRVVCRSVKDVTEVTGVRSQMVLLNLLHDERNNTLTTRGPYNSMFGRSSKDAGGFSIDEPVFLSTMIASGFIILKVLNEKGEHLVCMDVRKGSPGDTPVKGDFGTYLAYIDIGKDSIATGEKEKDDVDSVVNFVTRKSKDKETDKVLRLTPVNFRWTKVLGIYIRDSKFG
jgi:hypothetical protein